MQIVWTDVDLSDNTLKFTVDTSSFIDIVAENYFVNALNQLLDPEETAPINTFSDPTEYQLTYYPGAGNSIQELFSFDLAPPEGWYF
jgi:hypothetical protein